MLSLSIAVTIKYIRTKWILDVIQQYQHPPHLNLFFFSYSLSFLFWTISFSFCCYIGILFLWKRHIIIDVMLKWVQLVSVGEHFSSPYSVLLLILSSLTVKQLCHQCCLCQSWWCHRQSQTDSWDFLFFIIPKHDPDVLAANLLKIPLLNPCAISLQLSVEPPHKAQKVFCSLLTSPPTTITTTSASTASPRKRAKESGWRLRASLCKTETI